MKYTIDVLELLKVIANARGYTLCDFILKIFKESKGDDADLRTCIKDNPIAQQVLVDYLETS